jgi:hypothetical protein
MRLACGWLPGCIMLLAIQLGPGCMAETDLTYIELQRSGGQLATLRPTFRVTAKDLSPEDRQALDALIGKADVMHLPERFAGRSVPDAFEYRLSIVSPRQTRTIVFHDQDGHPEALDALAEWIRQKKTR